MRRAEHERMKFQAALKGVNLDGNGESDEERFERIENQARARSLAGDDEAKVEFFTEKVTLGGIGIAIEED